MRWPVASSRLQLYAPCVHQLQVRRGCLSITADSYKKATFPFLPPSGFLETVDDVVAELSDQRVFRGSCTYGNWLSALCVRVVDLRCVVRFVESWCRRSA